VHRRHFLWLGAGGIIPAAAQSPPPANPFGLKLVTAARRQVGVTTVYDPAYVGLKYPGGDVPTDRGVCTDVVIRAFRVLGLDLQEFVHLDMREHFSAYPKIWGLKKPDPNIDHRRVPNLMTFLSRRGKRLELTKTLDGCRAGDLVTCTVPPNRPHIMVVSDQVGASGRPHVIHNIGLGAREEDVLLTYPLTGHFRWA
jgi:uncharacterized protein YijF (DUF1287 family)